MSESDFTPPEFPDGVIIVFRAGLVVQTAPMGPKPLTIGRLPQNDLVLSDDSVSRYHAEVRLEGAQATVTDVGSSGGTFVGGEPLPPRQPRTLETGETFRIGPFDLTFVAPTQPKRVDVRPSTARIGGAEQGRAADESHAADEAHDEGNGHDGGRPEPVEEPGKKKRWRTPREGAGRVPKPSETEATLEHVDATKRPRHPVPTPDIDSPSAYLKYLPGIYHDADFLRRMMLIFEALWEPLEWRQSHIHFYFDPRTAPWEFLGWLASWLGLTLDKHWPEERRRQLLTEAMELYRWRGTSYGLEQMIKVCTGVRATITDEPNRPFVMRVRVQLPSDSLVRAEMIERLVQMHKPAHVGYVLEVSS